MGFHVLGLVPARGGSKSIPRKNIRLLGGKPLLQYTVESSLQARRLDRLILSTDDPEIAEVGRRCGIEVPFLRPPELATDSSPTLPVVQHALRWLEEGGDRFDAVCLLQPTNPLRRAEYIDACIDLLESSPDVSAVVSVLPVPVEYNPWWVYLTDGNGYLTLAAAPGRDPIPRRQELPEAFHRAGSVYVTRRDVVMTENSLYGCRLRGYPMLEEDCLDLNTASDWSRAEARICGQ